MRGWCFCAVIAAVALPVLLCVGPFEQSAAIAQLVSASQELGTPSSYIIIRLKLGAHERFREVGPGASPREWRSFSVGFQSAARQWRAIELAPVSGGVFADRALAARHALDRTYILRVPPGTDTIAMAAAFGSLADVESAGCDTIGGIAEGDWLADASNIAGLIPNDASFAQQWSMHNTGQTIMSQVGTPDADIDAPEAWALHTGDFGSVVVALIDSGLDSHPEFGNNEPPYPNGRVLQGYNTVLDSDAPADLDDDCHHGTHIAGIIGASGNNGAGVAGVSWGAYLMPVKVLTGCSGTATDGVEGIIWAADHGADVISMPLQYNLTDPAVIALMQGAADYAHDHGAVVIAATGLNNFCGTGAVCYPGRLNNVLAVSSTNNRDLFMSSPGLSNYGPETDLAAPGAYIYSTWFNAAYFSLSGTSPSAAHVSGLAALIKSYAPYRTNDQIAQILQDSADDLGDPGWDDHFGYGRINAASALAAALQCDDVLECDDGNPCTDDDCVGGMCAFVNNTATCGDAVSCTVGDTCADGSCGVPDDAMCDDANDCTLDVCDPLKGCIHQPVVCDDSNLCTTDTCDPMSGCVYTSSVVCDVPPGDPACHEPGVCVPATGMCDYVPFLEGDPCTPQPVDLCCAEYTCITSVCTAQCDPLCDDGNVCTTDTCGPNGCVNMLVDCDDGLFCTADSCDPDTGCIAVSACPPGIEGCVFRNDSCDEDNDACVDLADDSQCDDGNVCNGTETCDVTTGGCLPGTPPACLGGDGCCPVGCTDTNDGDCPLAPIPTVSTWGLVVLALLLATMAKASVRRLE